LGKIFRHLNKIYNSWKEILQDINFSPGGGELEQIYLDRARRLRDRYRKEGTRPTTRKFRRIDEGARAMAAVLWNKYLNTGLHAYYVADIDGVLYYFIKVIGDEVMYNVLTRSELVGLGYNPDKLEINLTGGTE